jgi:hypothetical protein
MPSGERSCYHRWRSIFIMKYLEDESRGREFLDDDDDDFEDDVSSVISGRGRGEGVMDETAATGAGAGRRNEDIALDLMKFIAMTTGYGKTASSGGVGFTGGGAAAKPEDYATHLLELYGKCLGAVGAKK